VKPIEIKEPKKFEGKPGEDFDTWWVLVQVYIQDQPEKFPKDEQTIDWIGSLMDRYAASWHIQWLKGTLNGTYPMSMTGYVQALKLRFEDKEAKDEAHASLEKLHMTDASGICLLKSKLITIRLKYLEQH